MLWKTDTYTAWGRVHRATGDIARPERGAALTTLLADGPIPAVGNRRSYGDAPLNDGGRVIDMTRMDKILSFDAETGVIDCEAGVALTTLVQVFAPKGWIPTVVPGTGFATVGGAIAQDVHGKNHAEGSFGEHVISITLDQGGKRVTCSPKRLKTLFRATVGGIGQTGVIVSAKFQMKRSPGTTMRVKETRLADWDEQIEALTSSTATYAVSWIDAQARGTRLGRGILEEGELATSKAPKPAKPMTVPLTMPLFSNGLFAKVFNLGYYLRVPSQGRVSVKRLEEFFFPLDKKLEITRLYGTQGFHQFQCVVPTDQVEVLHAMMEKVAASGLASPLAVLKRSGPGGVGMLSFPIEGFTLAIDFPNSAKANGLIGELEDMTAQAGGKLYLAKDSLASGERIKQMYPEHKEWAKEAAKADPTGALATDMVRRLELRA